MSKRKNYPSAAQKIKLLHLISEDDELRYAKFSANFTKKVSEQRWNNIAKEINAIPGAQKSWKEWRKTWQDIKSKTKKKQSAIIRATNTTGGGPPPPPLNEEEALVLHTISTSSINGHTDSQESLVEMIDFTKSPKLPLSVVPTHVEAVTLEAFEEPKPSASTKHVALEKGKKKSAKKRLQESLAVAKALEGAIKEKNDIKRKFNEEYLKEMRRQTEALLLIANNLNS